jgi:ABC-type multidrug transport system permease subunit
MLRTGLLILRNEFRLLAQDRMALFMLFLAPIVIIAVAGFSLGNMFGAGTRGRTYVIPLVDYDHGEIAHAIIKGLSHQRALRIIRVSDARAARALVARSDRSPMAILIPAGTTKAFEDGRTALIDIYVDPVKRVEASVFELRLSALTREIAARAHHQAQVRLSDETARVRAEVDRVSKQVDALREQASEYRQKMRQERSRFRWTLEARIREKLRLIGAQTQVAIDQAMAEQKTRLQDELSRKQVAMKVVLDYLRELQASRRAFEQWMARLKAKAGSYASEIPPPPRLPTPPNTAQLAELSRPLDLSFVGPSVSPETLEDSRIELPRIRMPKIPRISLNVRGLAPSRTPILPGAIGWTDRSLTPGYAQVNSFDQYVPGFGITFLLLDVLWGVSIGLIDERDWGTLQRLRVSGASVPGMMIGKLAARFLSGFVQMVVLFGVGWLLFGIELGRSPAVLLLPTAAISFAAAAFGLVIAAVARTRDSVLPIGSVAAMTMAAVGGCWWPINFEPVWMRSVAAWMPTTWTMRAYNDLMIRGLKPTHALWPSMVTLALGIAFLCVGVIGARRVYE